MNVGDRLGPYEVLRKIASGGMGEVYEATDVRLKRRVAVKVLTAAPSDSGSRGRILEEARILSRLNHPSICTIHDVGVYNGVPYLVMELLEGTTLRDAVRKQRPSESVALEWAIQFSEALRHAHARGVVHRDIKPENVVITKTGAKLVDFGISGLTTATSESEQKGGTLPYMAPELLRGDRATPQSDLYAFGAVLRELFPDGRTQHVSGSSQVNQLPSNEVLARSRS